MYCINFKQQFDVCFMIKAAIISRQPLFIMFQERSALQSTDYLFPTLGYALIFSETGAYSLHRIKMIVVFELNEKIIVAWYLFPRKNDDSSLASQAVKQKPPFCRCCGYVRAQLLALMTRKSCSVGDAQCNCEE